eukprot:jgi/Phyca11/97491/e_gw1.2.1214.1
MSGSLEAELCMLFALIGARRRFSEAFDGLRRAVVAERLRWEWTRSIRIRHYVTLDCLKSPEESPWMEMWRSGTDKNFLTVTSLTKYGRCMLVIRHTHDVVFSSFYHIPTYNRTEARSPRLQHHHHVLGALLCFYVDSVHGSLLYAFWGTASYNV